MATRKQQKARRRAKRRQQKGATGKRAVSKAPDGWGVLEAPSERMQHEFAILAETIDEANASLSKIELSSPEDKVFSAIFVRGTNSLKCVKLLIENAHWDIAQIVTRQLYELLVDVEYILNQDDLESTIHRYMKFGVLRKLLDRRAGDEYDRSTGRSIDEQRHDHVVRMLDGGSFEEFKDSRSPTGWSSNWCGVSIYQRARDSPRPMRLKQYDTLYRSWSDQVHVSPSTLVDDVYRTAPLDLEREMAGTDTEVFQVILMSVVLFNELWHSLPAVSDTFDVDRTYARQERLIEAAGGGQGSGLA